MFVVVESDKGEDMARVCAAPRMISVPDEQVMKKILRIADTDDLKAREQNFKDEPKASSTINARSTAPPETLIISAILSISGLIFDNILFISLSLRGAKSTTEHLERQVRYMIFYAKGLI